MDGFEADRFDDQISQANGEFCDAEKDSSINFVIVESDGSHRQQSELSESSSRHISRQVSMSRRINVPSPKTFRISERLLQDIQSKFQEKEAARVSALDQLRCEMRCCLLSLISKVSEDLRLPMHELRMLEFFNEEIILLNSENTAHDVDGFSKKWIDQQDPNRHETLSCPEILSDLIKVVGDRLGEGSFGRVYRAQLLQDINPQLTSSDIVALKTFFKIGEEVQPLLRKEVKVMMRLAHQNIVQFHAVVVDENHLLRGILMEYCIGSLLNAIMDKDSPARGALSPWDFSRKIEIMGDCADALLHMTRFGILHRDIKPENILVSVNGVIKLADFGEVKVLSDFAVNFTESELKTEQRIQRSLLYMAPELFEQAIHEDGGVMKLKTSATLPYSTASDVYALGITCNELFSEQLFRHHEIFKTADSCAVVIKKMLEEKTRPQIFAVDLESDVSAWEILSQSIGQMWTVNVVERPSLRSLLCTIKTVMESRLLCSHYGADSVQRWMLALQAGVDQNKLTQALSNLVASVDETMMDSTLDTAPENEFVQQQAWRLLSNTVTESSIPFDSDRKLISVLTKSLHTEVSKGEGANEESMASMLRILAHLSKVEHGRKYIVTCAQQDVFFCHAIWQALSMAKTIAIKRYALITLTLLCSESSSIPNFLSSATLHRNLLTNILNCEENELMELTSTVIAKLLYSIENEESRVEWFRTSNLMPILILTLKRVTELEATEVTTTIVVNVLSTLVLAAKSGYQWDEATANDVAQLWRLITWADNADIPSFALVLFTNVHVDLLLRETALGSTFAFLHDAIKSNWVQVQRQAVNVISYILASSQHYDVKVITNASIPLLMHAATATCEDVKVTAFDSLKIVSTILRGEQTSRPDDILVFLKDAAQHGHGSVRLRAVGVLGHLARDVHATEDNVESMLLLLEDTARNCGDDGIRIKAIETMMNLVPGPVNRVLLTSRALRFFPLLVKVLIDNDITWPARARTIELLELLAAHQECRAVMTSKDLELLPTLMGVAGSDSSFTGLRAKKLAGTLSARVSTYKQYNWYAVVVAIFAALISSATLYWVAKPRILNQPLHGNDVTVIETDIDHPTRPNALPPLIHNPGYWLLESNRLGGHVDWINTQTGDILLRWVPDPLNSRVVLASYNASEVAWDYAHTKEFSVSSTDPADAIIVANVTGFQVWIDGNERAFYPCEKPHLCGGDLQPVSSDEDHVWNITALSKRDAMTRLAYHKERAYLMSMDNMWVVLTNGNSGDVTFRDKIGNINLYFRLNYQAGNLEFNSNSVVSGWKNMTTQDLPTICQPERSDSHRITLAFGKTMDIKFETDCDTKVYRLEHRPLLTPRFPVDHPELSPAFTMLHSPHRFSRVSDFQLFQYAHLWNDAKFAYRLRFPVTFSTQSTDLITLQKGRCSESDASFRIQSKTNHSVIPFHLMAQYECRRFAVGTTWESDTMNNVMFVPFPAEVFGGEKVLSSSSSSIFDLEVLLLATSESFVLWFGPSYPCFRYPYPSAFRWNEMNVLYEAVLLQLDTVKVRIERFVEKGWHSSRESLVDICVDLSQYAPALEVAALVHKA